MVGGSCDAPVGFLLDCSGSRTQHQRQGMSYNTDKVKDIIEKELGVERDKLTNEASLIEDLGADSLDIVELVMEFEKEFNIDIPDEDAEKLRTVGDVQRSEERRVGKECRRLCRS